MQPAESSESHSDYSKQAVSINQVPTKSIAVEPKSAKGERDTFDEAVSPAPNRTKSGPLAARTPDRGTHGEGLGAPAGDRKAAAAAAADSMLQIPRRPARSPKPQSIIKEKEKTPEKSRARGGTASVVGASHRRDGETTDRTFERDDRTGEMGPDKPSRVSATRGGGW